MVAIASLVSFAYSTFETKDDSKEKKAEIVQRLDRMENKLDILVLRKSR